MTLAVAAGMPGRMSAGASDMSKGTREAIKAVEPLSGALIWLCKFRAKIAEAIDSTL